MLNDATKGLSWKEHEVKKSQVLARNQRIAQGSVTMRNYVDEMINKNVESGNLKDE